MRPAARSAAPLPQRLDQRGRVEWPTRHVGKPGQGERFARQGLQHRLDAFDRPGAFARHRRAGFGQLRLDPVEPLRVRFARVGQQAVTFAQRRLQPRGLRRMARRERQHQPIKEAPPPTGAFAEKAVHRRGQPADRKPFRQPIGGRGCAVDLNQPLAGLRGLGSGAEPHRIARAAVEHRADRKAARPLLRRHVRKRRPPQPPARREQRNRFEHIGLARAVLAHQQVELARIVNQRLAVIAELAERNTA